MIKKDFNNIDKALLAPGDCEPRFLIGYKMLFTCESPLCATTLILFLERGRMETIDAEIADPGLGATVDDQLRYHGTSAGAELEAMQQKAELVIKALVTCAGPEHG